MKILLVRLREIGDVVFTTPAIRALRARFPDAHLTYLVEPAAAPIVEHNPHLNEVVIARRLRGAAGLRADVALGRRLRGERFDVAIDFHGGPRASLLTWLSGAPQRIGYTIPLRSWIYTTRIRRSRELRARHSVVNQWDLLAPLGVAPPDPRTFPADIAVDADAAARVEARVSPLVGPDSQLIVVHVSAGNPFRRWPLESFARLAAELAGRMPSRRVVFTTGPSEHGELGRVIAATRDRLPSEARERVLAPGDFSLAELRALVERAALYIGGDSGPMHVASASRVPIVSLYGPTLPARSAPWRDPGLAAAAVERLDLPCRPCDQRVCVHGDFRCLTGIAPETVVAAAERLLGAPAIRWGHPDE